MGYTDRATEYSLAEINQKWGEIRYNFILGIFGDYLVIGLKIGSQWAQIEKENCK